MRALTVGALLLWFVLPAYAGAQPLTLTLDEAVALGLRQNKTVKLSFEDMRKAKAKLAEVSSARLPSVSFSGSWTDTRELYAKDVRSLKTDVGLSQVLYRGGRTVNTIAFSEEGVIVAQALLDKAKLDAALHVRTAFFTCLLSRDLVQVNKRILENTRQHLTTANVRYGAGQASHSDLLRIEQSLATVAREYEASVNQREAAVAQLKNLLAIDEDTAVDPLGEFTYQPQEIAYDVAFLRAMRERPEIRQYEAQQKQAIRSVDIAKGQSRPTITAAWDYYSSSTPALATSSATAWNDYQVMGLSVSWPIFDGWAAKHKVQQALSDLSQADIAREKARLDIALEVKRSYLDLKNALEAIKASHAEAVLFKDASEVAHEKYGKGELSMLDEDDASVRNEIAQFNNNQALYDYSVAKVTFEKAAGGLQ